MQTFLPYCDFMQSAESLDNKRAFKQVVEAKQIICSLRSTNLPDDWMNSTSYINQIYKNHPARLMWVGYEDCLKEYYNFFLRYVKYKLKYNTSLPELQVPSIYYIP